MKGINNENKNRNKKNKKFNGLSFNQNTNTNNKINNLNKTRNSKSHGSDISFMSSYNITLEEVKNRLKEKLISVIYGNKNEIDMYVGPVNIGCLAPNNYDESIYNLIKKIKINGYQYNRVDKNLFRCIKGNKIFDIEIVKIKGNLLYYLIKN